MSHFTYEVKYLSGKIQEFIVHEIETVEAFVAQHFGSVDPAEHGVAVSLIAIDGQPTPSAEVQQTPLAPTQANPLAKPVADFVEIPEPITAAPAALVAVVVDTP